MRILVTGAGGAIGAATAVELAGAGHEVVATARDPTLLEPLEVAARLVLDVTDDASVAAALEAAGPLDAVVNNAGQAARGVLEGYPPDTMAAMFATNTIGAIRVVQHVLPGWRARGHGVVVNISSVQGRVATPLAGVYAATKAALESLSEALHYEVGRFGIRVVVIEPGYIAPGMKAGPDLPTDPAYDELVRQWDGADAKVTGPGGRPGPEVVARAVRAAVEDDATPLRVPVGEDARLVLGLRAQLDDATFEATMREFLGLTW